MIKIEIFREGFWIHTTSVDNDTLSKLKSICVDTHCDIIVFNTYIKVCGTLPNLYKCLYVISCEEDIFIR